VIEKIDPQQGWVSCEAVMRWFGVDHKAVVEWAQRGLLDCATEKGSEVRYYRVLNPEALRNAMPKQEKRQGGRRRFKP
jgi:hypothetical protein